MSQEEPFLGNLADPEPCRHGEWAPFGNCLKCVAERDYSDPAIAHLAKADPRGLPAWNPPKNRPLRWERFQRGE